MGSGRRARGRARGGGAALRRRPVPGPARCSATTTSGPAPPNGASRISTASTISRISPRATCIFAATGVTDGSLLEGVKRRKNCITTESVVMRASTGTVRWVKGEHRHEPGGRCADADPKWRIQREDLCRAGLIVLFASAGSRRQSPAPDGVRAQWSSRSQLVAACCTPAGDARSVKLGLDRFSSILLLALGPGRIAALCCCPSFDPPARAAWRWVAGGRCSIAATNSSLIRGLSAMAICSQVDPLARGTRR